MADMPSFTTADLRAWMDALCTSLEHRNLATFKPKHDHYWSLSVEDAFDLSREPKVLAGQVSDDIYDLRREVEDTSDRELSEQVIAFHMAEHLSGLLGYVALVSGPHDDKPVLADPEMEVG